MMARRLPKVDELAARLELPPPLAVEIARQTIASARGNETDVEAAARQLAAAVAATSAARIINASGVLLHTNLGRAPWPQAATSAAAGASASYSNLEFDPATGARSKRGSYAGRLAAALTGAEAGLVVNNNAAALSLALAAIAGGGNVAVSRGELIEIGGSFRLPDVMTAVGCRLLEVGTTNRTRPSDFESVADSAAMLLKVHPANYRVEGFTESVGYRQMADIAKAHGKPFVADVGSGLLDARTPWLRTTPPPWLEGEAAVRQTLEAGADVVLFSGDKLLGGPQAGIAVGGAELISAMARHPLARAFRCDGATIAAVEATLELYAAGKGDEVPFWVMATLGGDALEERCRRVVDNSGIAAQIVEGRSVPGAGSVPGRGIPGPVISATGMADRWSALLVERPPILARRQDDDLVVDLRAVSPDDDKFVASALAEACR
jgi:L-seryl-tRNA(Ser) seleniumtransferase